MAWPEQRVAMHEYPQELLWACGHESGLNTTQQQHLARVCSARAETNCICALWPAASRAADMARACSARPHSSCPPPQGCSANTLHSFLCMCSGTAVLWRGTRCVRPGTLGGPAALHSNSSSLKGHLAGAAPWRCSCSYFLALQCHCGNHLSSAAWWRPTCCCLPCSVSPSGKSRPGTALLAFVRGTVALWTTPCMTYSGGLCYRATP